MPTVEQVGAGSTLPVVAALLGAGEAEPLAQRIQQRRARINGQLVGRSVHPQGDFKVHRKRVSFGRVSYKRLSAFKRKKNLPDRLHGLCTRPIPLQITHQLNQAGGLCASLDDGQRKDLRQTGCGYDVGDQRAMIHRDNRTHLRRLIVDDEERSVFWSDQVILHLIAYRLTGHGVPSL